MGAAMKRDASNTRRRFIGALIAAGFVAPGTVAQSALGQSPTPSKLPECRRGARGDGPITRGEQYRAVVYSDGERCTAVIPMKKSVPVPGIRGGRFGITLSADSEKGRAKLLTLRFPGLNKKDKKMVEQMRFSVSVNGQRYPGYTAPHYSVTFAMFYSAREILPRTFFSLTHDVEVGVYMPGKPSTGAPDYVLHFDKTRIAGATRLAQREMGKLRQDLQAGRCRYAQRRGCFMTTAAVELFGLPDDCWELQQLRHLRDQWLAKQPGGPDQIAEYYDRAPLIAAALQSDPKRLARLYFSHILPSAIAARLGLNRYARWLYVRMMQTVSDIR
jgi:hypothetical protein